MIRDLKNFDEVEACLAAVERLHRTADMEDVPRLRALLDDERFFVREAAAWPLSVLARAEVLPDLFRAYPRGFDEGHDNDGFTSVLIELAEADPQRVKQKLGELMVSGNPAIQESARWLLQFCGKRA